MGGLKKKGIVKQHTKQYYGIVTEPIPITQISDDLSEEQFLVAYRNLVTYDERKEQLLKRGYKLVDGEWVKNKKLLTTITIEGRDTGARVTIPIEISKTPVGTVFTQGESGIQLK